MNTPATFLDRLGSSPVYFPHWPLEKVLACCRDIGFHKFEGFSECPMATIGGVADAAALLEKFYLEAQTHDPVPFPQYSL